jgi:hypothetical protein
MISTSATAVTAEEYWKLIKQHEEDQQTDQLQQRELLDRIRRKHRRPAASANEADNNAESGDAAISTAERISSAGSFASTSSSVRSQDGSGMRILCY